MSGGTKLFFGLGAVGEAVYVAMFTVFTQIFYNQAIGLSNTLTGLAIALAMFSDAISDPLVGVISDRWKSRHGRRHPFLFIAPLPLAISLWCIFNPPAFLTSGPDGISQWGVFTWLAVFTILSRTFLTLYAVPHLALGGELSKDQHQRSQLFSANSVLSSFSGAAFLFVAYTYFFAGERVRERDGELVLGQLDPAAYGPVILIAFVLIIVTIWLSAAGTYKHVPNLSQPDDNQPRLTFAEFFREIGGTLRNKNYLRLLIGFFFFMIASAIYNSMSEHVRLYFWELVPEQTRWLALISAPGTILGALLAPALMHKFDRKPVLLSALAGTFFFAQLVVDLRLFGLMPENGSPNLLPILLANAAAFYFCLGVGAVAIASMIGDVIDENELTTHRRQEGLFYSARAFFAKASFSLGLLFAGVMLDAFVKLPQKAIPGELDADIVMRLGITAGPIMSIAGFIAWFIYYRYNLPRERHAEIIAEIEARKAHAVLPP